ncbi:PREDICTED: NAD-dependent protein deacetylase sirtuin-2-like [Ceratosolen solmsi marchali]|uniref:NAD-dependent protein deacetylase sirtuin-2-like n=1 Tax=Ceratosolen solmsi marchali TaxID=326594 RepID=A0AAJ6YIP5_9HYME|nr:PREDICTED: NAD-dependent protein deacetylase sirtuin-2-like [Ceratosolen solmsi marchali]
MAGAGISTSAGIPDFRSPTTGLYDHLEKYNLPYPQAISEIEFFKSNPKPFFVLTKELLPEGYKPTKSHYLFENV